MTPSGVVALYTDFGLVDPFAGVMKGVLLTRAPAARIIDVTHGLPPQDVAAAAFWLERSYRWLPPGTVHLVVVDPGVGTARAPLAARAGEHWFVAPDNGVLSGILLEEARVIDFDALALSPPSRTFHGRDVFAPAAAELAAGRLELPGLGALARSLSGLERTPPARSGERVIGHVVVVDHFGNLITDLEPRLFSHVGAPSVTIAGRRAPLADTYADVAEGALVALVNSIGTLEIACRGGSARDRLDVGAGAEVVVEGSREP